MSGLFQKLIGYFLNEFIVKTLANNKSFQRFALKIDAFVTTKKAAVNNITEEAVKKGGEAIKSKAAPIQNGKLEIGGIDFGKFASEFKNEISENINGSTAKKKK